MNVLIIPSWYRSLNQPNSGVFFRDQAKAIASNGHTVVLLDASLRDRSGWFSKDCMRFNKVVDENITVYTFNFPSLIFGKFPYIHCFVYGISLEYLVRKAKKDGFNADIIHAHSVYPAGYVVSKHKSKVPIIITEHSSAFSGKQKNKSLKSIMQKSYDRSDKFICVSESLKLNIEDNLKIKNSKIIVIPNMINDIFVYKPRIKKNEFIFLSVGNLVENKKMDYLIKAFAQKFTGSMNVKLRIVGNGKMKNELQSLIDNLKLNNQVQLIGELSHIDILSEYQKCDVFVLASNSETFGVVFREAMAVGRPIIAYSNGGIDEDITSFNGLFLKENSIEKLADALTLIKNKIEFFDNERISKNCLSKYSKHVIIKQILEIYKQLSEI